MRQLLKFSHSLAAIGLLGSIIILFVLHQQLPDPFQSINIYVSLRQSMERIASLVLLPSLMLTVISGLISMAVVPGFHDSPWAWVKLLTSIVILEGSLLGIQGPIEKEAALAQAALSETGLIGSLSLHSLSEQRSLILIGFAASLNVALGVWRPKFGSVRASS